MSTTQPKIQDPYQKDGSFCRLTSRGWVFLLISAAAIVGGVGFGVSGVVLVGLIGLVVVGVSRPLAKWNIAGLEFSRQAPEEVYAGQSFPMLIKLKNTRPRWDAFAVDYEDGVAGPLEKGMHAAWVRAGGTVERKCETRMLRRGVQHRVRNSLESSFPLGLWLVRRETKETFEMTVYPRPVTPRILEDPEFLTMLEADEAESMVYDTSGDFHGIREFQPGDRLKNIDWAATARASKIMVRQFDKRLPSRYLVIFHSASAKGAHGEAFDSAMEMLCGLMSFAHDGGVPVDFHAGFNNWKPQKFGTEEKDRRRALKMLAMARRRSEADLQALQPILANVEASMRIFVLSDVAVKEWEHTLPDVGCMVTCLSVSDLRVKQPRIYRRELAPPPIAEPKSA